MASQSDLCFIVKGDVHNPPLKRLASTSTKGLVQRLRFAKCDSREKSAMLAMVAGMVNKFAEAQPQSYWREAEMLSSVVTDNQYRQLVTDFANTIIRGTTDGTILDPELLTCFAFVLRYAPHTLSAKTHMLGSVLKSLQTLLEKAQRQSEPEAQYQVTSILSIVLDAMVDVKVSGIDRETLHALDLKREETFLSAPPKSQLARRPEGHWRVI